jgi:hypothetical protein
VLLQCLPACAIEGVLAHGQGVRLTSPLGCSPWRSEPPPGRGAYMVTCTQAEILCGGMRTSLRVLPSRSSFGYADEPADRETSGSGRFSAAAELWCDEWMEWVERLESEVEDVLQPNKEEQDGNDCQEEEEEEEEDQDGAEFEIAWLMARFETAWSAAKQQSKRTSLIAKYGEHSNFVVKDIFSILAKLRFDIGTLLAGISLALELARERYERQKDAAAVRELAVQAARRRRLWMAQLNSFAAASQEAREAVLNLLPTVAGANTAKERSTFTWCVYCRCLGL